MKKKTLLCDHCGCALRGVAIHEEWCRFNEYETAKNEVERLKAELAEVAKIGNATASLKDERIEVLENELERKKKEAAEMREALEMCSQVCDEMATIAWDESSDVDAETFSALHEKVNRALSSHRGQGYVRASEFSDTITTLEDLAECWCPEHAKEAQNELARLTALMKGASK